MPRTMSHFSPCRLKLRRAGFQYIHVHGSTHEHLRLLPLLEVFLQMGLVSALDESILSQRHHVIQKGTIPVHQPLQSFTLVVDPEATL